MELRRSNEQRGEEPVACLGYAIQVLNECTYHSEHATYTPCAWAVWDASRQAN